MAKGNTPSPKGGGTGAANSPVYGYLGGGTKGGGATAAAVSKSIKKPINAQPAQPQNPSLSAANIVAAQISGQSSNTNQNTNAQAKNAAKINAAMDAYNKAYDDALKSGKTAAQASSAATVAAYNAAGKNVGIANKAIDTILEKKNAVSVDTASINTIVSNGNMSQALVVNNITSNNKDDNMTKIPKGWNKKTTYSHNATNLNYKDEQVSQIRKDTGVTDADAAIMQSGISHFTGAEYGAMRAIQMGEKSSDATLTKEVGYVERYIQKAPKFAGVTYRGINLTQKNFQSFIDAAKNGTSVNMSGMASWSSALNVAHRFSRKGTGAKCIFICPGGQPQGTSIKHLSMFHSEDEVLVSSKAKYKVKYKGTDDKGTHYFEMTSE